MSHFTSTIVVRRSGNGTAIDIPQRVIEATAGESPATRHQANSDLLHSLREDPRSEDLMRQCREDAHAGRMSVPCSVDKLDLSRVSPGLFAVLNRGPHGTVVGEVVLSPRFCIEQGSLYLAAARPPVRRGVMCVGQA